MQQKLKYVENLLRD